MNSISFVLGVKRHSVRCKNKNLRSFGDSNLLVHKIDLLTSIRGTTVTVHTEDYEIAEMINNKYGKKVNVVIRDEYYASSKCTGSEFFENLAQNTDAYILIYAPVTSPFVDISKYQQLIDTYLVNSNKFDSVVLAEKMDVHMWKDGNPLNYDLNNMPNTQDLPEIWGITYGGCVISRGKAIENKNFVGNNPLFVRSEGIELIDIDTELDFSYAEHVYKSGLWN